MGTQLYDSEVTMAIQTIFKRHELKYQLTKTQYYLLCETMKSHMLMDDYGRHKISNIYFDTDDFRIIRHSIDRPKYKEKLRLRIYGKANDNTTSFIELKKKLNGVVYKRRLPTTVADAMSYLCNESDLNDASQIKKEVDYFKSSHKRLAPRVYLSYEREAYYTLQDEDFRITFDFNIRMRDTDISPYESEDDIRILPDDRVLMEVKTVQGLPFWFVDFLGENGLYTTSFSKYGTAYKLFIFPKYLDYFRGMANAQ